MSNIAPAFIVQRAHILQRGMGSLSIVEDFDIVEDFASRLVEGMATAGVVVFETGRLFGGDSGYYYLGTYEVAGGRLSGTAKVQHYNGPPSSAFGPDIKVHEVEFEGDIEGGEISG